ncbi:hypothetical protein VT98_11764, partial [Candidatus Electrothrix communis]
GCRIHEFLALPFQALAQGDLIGGAVGCAADAELSVLRKEGGVQGRGDPHIIAVMGLIWIDQLIIYPETEPGVTVVGIRRVALNQ